MFGIGMTELLVILVVGLLVLGPKRLPELARSLGRGLAEFRRASSDMRREFLDVTEEVQRTEPSRDSADATVPPDESAPRLDEPDPRPEPANAGTKTTDPRPEPASAGTKTTDPRPEPANAGTKSTDPVAGTKGG